MGCCTMTPRLPAARRMKALSLGVSDMESAFMYFILLAILNKIDKNKNAAHVQFLWVRGTTPRET
jgi:hypothetical protein